MSSNPEWCIFCYEALGFLREMGCENTPVIRVSKALRLSNDGPDSNRGEFCKAFISLKEECKGKVSGQEIIDRCKNSVTPYKRTREVEFRDRLSRYGAGNILKRALL
jgi:acyl-CoA synthetase (AMP-forming)/AMP-acid ligase II